VATNPIWDVASYGIMKVYENQLGDTYADALGA
jgi:hypothetical protein